MPRESRPRYWSQRRAWYAMKDGKRHVLYKLGKQEVNGPDAEAAAWEKFRELNASLRDLGVVPLQPHQVPSVELLGKRFLLGIPLDRSEVTRKAYDFTVRSFCRVHGKKAAEDIRPIHVREWLDRHQWGANTTNVQVSILKWWWKWSEEQGLIPSNPLAKVRKPPARPREQIPTPKEAESLLAADLPTWVKDILTAIYRTGCRPAEVYRVEAKDVDMKAGTWTIHGKTTRATGRKRVVFFDAKDIREIVARLIKQNPTGPLFRNSKGGRVYNYAINWHVQRWREANGVGDHVTPGSLRHLFATDALAKGVDPAIVATLLGHVGTKQLFQTYGRLLDRPGPLREAVKKIRGDD